MYCTYVQYTAAALCTQESKRKGKGNRAFHTFYHKARVPRFQNNPSLFRESPAIAHTYKTIPIIQVAFLEPNQSKALQKECKYLALNLAKS